MGPVRTRVGEGLPMPRNDACSGIAGFPHLFGMVPVVGVILTLLAFTIDTTSWLPQGSKPKSDASQRADAPGPVSTLVSLAFSRDGARLAAAGWDGSVRLWDVRGRREEPTLHEGTVPAHSVAVRPDG